MTDASAAPPARPRPPWRPWSRRKSTGADVALGVLLLLVEVAVAVLHGFGTGMEVWAAQGEAERIEAAELAELTWLSYHLVVVLALAAVAALFRARWTVVFQLLAALAVAALLALAQHDADRLHPDPPPRPGPEYVPCYSGSGRCN
ncbi:DUF6234 family protein [Streptomyces antimicrobicus]|uniref:DUF6234 family protein n=1 Tax=Streptomyces antimicrobicus TaxID=2883108 RepID=A0ABS8B443_9ACTN|nr:DUF6234 family protein [Streptomyces antimicrobicus]MCB5179395.1 DUF6234 family protein [Streptomyces antimicrobicus]